MRREKVWGLVLSLAVGSAMTGCAQEKSHTEEVKKAEPAIQYVHTKTLSSESYQDEENYSGYVAAKETKKYAFEIAGTVSKVSVEKGQYISKGQVLAQLDTSTLALGVQHSKEDANMAANKITQAKKSVEVEQLTLEKIKDTYDANIAQLQTKYDLQKEICDGNIEVYESGAMSKLEVDNAETALKLLEDQIESMKTEKEENIQLEQTKISQLSEQIQAADITLNQAQVGVAKSQKMIDQSTLKSTINGYVLEVPVKAGEVAAAGAPIVVVKTTEEVINMGITAEAYNKVKEGMTVQIEGEGESCKGIITKVALYPDEKTRTYNIEITPEKKDFVLGSLVTIKLLGDQHEGCFVPLSSVVNIDGVNYVYQVLETKSKGEYVIERTQVTLGKVKDENVLASNLAAGTIIVDQGVRDVKENDRVSI